MGKDRVSKEKRSEIMSKIRCSKTKPELKLNDILNSLPFIFVYLPPAPFKPDWIAIGKSTAIFMDGMFWHGYLPIPLDPFWVQKITRNMMRDREANQFYTSYGWDVIRVRENMVNKSDPEVLKRLLHLQLDKEASGQVWTL